MLPWLTVGKTKQMEAGDSEKDRYVSHGNRKLKLEESFLCLCTGVIRTHIKVSPSVHSSMLFSSLRLIALFLRFLISWPNRINLQETYETVSGNTIESVGSLLIVHNFFIEISKFLCQNTCSDNSRWMLHFRLL